MIQTWRVSFLTIRRSNLVYDFKDEYDSIDESLDEEQIRDLVDKVCSSLPQLLHRMSLSKKAKEAPKKSEETIKPQNFSCESKEDDGTITEKQKEILVSSSPPSSSEEVDVQATTLLSLNQLPTFLHRGKLGNKAITAEEEKTLDNASVPPKSVNLVESITPLMTTVAPEKKEKTINTSLVAVESQVKRMKIGKD